MTKPPIGSHVVHRRFDRDVVGVVVRNHPAVQRATVKWEDSKQASGHSWGSLRVLSPLELLARESE